MRPASAVRTFEKFFMELGFDQHPINPCVFILREPSSRCNKVHDDVVVTLSGNVGPPGRHSAFLGVHFDDQVNGGRGTRYTDAMKRRRARVPVRKWITGSGELTGSWLEQPDFPLCSLRRRTRLVSNRLKRDGTQIQTTVPLHSKSTITRLQCSNAAGWLGRHGQIRAARSVWQSNTCQVSR